MVRANLTVRFTNRAGTNIGHSDPVILKGKVTAKRIKSTPGITGLLLFRVPIDGVVWHLDVDFSYPGAVGGSKGSAVRRLKCNMSWV